MTTEDIRIDSANGIGFIALDRPKALNALSAPMLRAISEALRAWRHDQAIRTVVVYSPHVRAFCAGGDIRFLYESAQAGDRDSIDAFFTDEYKLNHAIFTFPKPYIAVMNGVVMGGGMGISQGAHHTGGLRIVTQSTKMAMPETRIGLFPDVGVSWFLARAPGAIGRYLAATGASMGAADALYARMADAYLDDGALPGLIESLRHQRFLDGVAIVRFVENETTKYKVSPTLDRSALAEGRTLIDKHFATGNGAAILASLARETDGAAREWAERVAAELRERSPLSVDVSLQQVDRARYSSMAETLRRDLDLTRTTFERGDVIEGIRARIVDKDNQPSWKIARAEEVGVKDVERMFESAWTPATHPLRLLKD
ncbi:MULTISPECIES: enoyl-CoA hydratase/isomerase family protein [unclassified Caballeronia]|uniref:enoyl-CoA hydratase/isomerase family protein n=1 Tax=unclassified Caballeronia TaxID=2646786 RepID=UPI001FD038C2|nr:MULTISPECIES: enoyl-CoA hydratase/isomerase family protein [unclassified Caballeronia]MDR5805108.1 enoyl-CoA hydratase/isomerase family protein [Caballeronia sp. LZ001]